MEWNLRLVQKESGISGVLFIGNDDTTSRIPLLNILESAKNLPVPVIEIVEYQCLFYDGVKNYGNLYVIDFLRIQNI